jgi:hypothetical protein
MARTSPSLQRQLVLHALDTPWFMQALVAVRELGLPSWCIGAGAVRNMVWDKLHGHSTPSSLADIDVTNQAGVHQWFETSFGHAVPPLHSLEEAVASWPEYATAVGVWLSDEGSIEVIAPHGLDDLFSLVIRRNPVRVSLDTYRQRVAQKNYTQRWPSVRVEAV